MYTHKDWQEQMHLKWGSLYEEYYGNKNTTVMHSGVPAFGSQFECSEFANYVSMRQSGTIKCPCCGK